MKKPSLYTLDSSIENKLKERGEAVSVSIDSPHFDEGAKKKVWVQIEPRSIRNPIPFLKQNHSKFDVILAWDKELLNFPNSKRFLYGTCWIDTENFVPNKKDVLSFLTSNKNFTDGHRIRHEVFSYLESATQDADYDVVSIMTPPRLEKKDVAFETAKYSIIIENEKEENWITEKLIDCFATKTIPIYWGAPNVGEFFDLKGMVVFNTAAELFSIVKCLKMEKYDALIESIEHNYTEAMKYADFFGRIDKEIDLL